ncbi:MAG: GT-D fold domain-containing protein [Lachnospiraceae bacterium]|nr:GT-D fold domain-containing protein [Lachnospiraceae bacterium]
MDNIDELKSRIDALEKENDEYRKWQSSVNQLLDRMLDMVTGLSDNKMDKREVERDLLNLWTYANINRYRINSLPYELQDPDYESFWFKPHILSKEETTEKIIREKKSFARLGDGEFASIVGQKRWNFQGESELLGNKMQEVLSSTAESLLIGLNPMFYRNLFDIPEDDADGVRAYMQPMVRRLHAQLLDRDRIYGNALFHNIESNEDVSRLKKIWDKRDCVFIEGIHTGMGVGNDLFDNCRSIERILGPAENAIDKYEEIIKEASKQPKEKLILIALGPTATVLAYELAKKGYQAVDIGHIDLIYEAFLRKMPNLYGVDISYKYCTKDERGPGREIENIEDSDYKAQTVAVIL